MTQTLTTAITASLGLTAVQAIIVPGTGTQHPADVANYLPNAVDHYLVPGGDCTGGCVLNPLGDRVRRPVLAHPTARLGRSAGREVERLGAERHGRVDRRVHHRAGDGPADRDIRLLAGRHRRQRFQDAARFRSPSRQGQNHVLLHRQPAAPEWWCFRAACLPGHRSHPRRDVRQPDADRYLPALGRFSVCDGCRAAVRRCRRLTAVDSQPAGRRERPRRVPICPRHLPLARRH